VLEKRVREGEVGRMGAHTDFDSFTLLWQDENAGLEVKVNGEWKGVEVVQGACVMNIGDVLGRWSNGELVSSLCLWWEE
jgi:isopenicillin N synthase-like dioxygenase